MRPENSPALLCMYGHETLTCCYGACERTALVLKWQRPPRPGAEVACEISKGRTVAEVGLWPLKIFAVTTADFCTAEQQAGLSLLGADTQIVVFGLLSRVRML